MTYQVKIVNNREGMDDFLHLPEKIYAGDKKYIPSVLSEIRRILDDKKNPYFSDAVINKFVCYDRNEPVARAVVTIKPSYWERWGKKSAFFGFFESVNDQVAVNNLFKAIEAFSAEQGAEYLEGPFNPNHYSEMGLLTRNFETPPAFFETQNPEWYRQLIENSGFIAGKTIHTRINCDATNWIKNNCRIIQATDRHKEYRVRYFNLWNYKKDMEAIRDINNDAFSGNPWFLPLSKEEYDFSGKFMFLVTSPKLISIIEFKNKPVGVVQCVYNINRILNCLKGNSGVKGLPKFFYRRSNLNEVVIYAAGVKKEFRNTITSCLIFNELCKIMEKYPVVYTTWMSDDNVRATRSADKLGLVPYKWFTIYSKPIR